MNSFVWGILVVAAFYVGFLVCGIFAGRRKPTPKPQAPAVSGITLFCSCGALMPESMRLHGYVPGQAEDFCECVFCGTKVCVRWHLESNQAQRATAEKAEVRHV